MRRGLPLTRLERQTLAMYAVTGDYREAARRLGIPESTWRNRAGRAYEKLGVKGAVQAFRALDWLRPFLRPIRVALGNSGQTGVGLT